MPSESVENYLKCIYALERDVDSLGVSTNAIAERMDTKASSVTDMLKKLEQKGLVNYRKYKGATLTQKGKGLAVEIVRKHRLWEVFLVDKLGFKWDEVHDIAEQLEHVDSFELIERLNRYLDNPVVDPHGDPIPDADGHVNEPRRVILDALEPGQEGVVVGVEDSSTEFLQFLDSIKLTLGVKVKVVNRFDFDRSVQLQTASGERQVSHAVARNLFIRIN